VYILPLRNVFVTAKAVATLDRISQGRVILGAGVGWLKEEFEVAGEDFHTRGRRADEAIQVLRRLWSEEVIEHHGEFYDFGPVKFNPKPSQKPGPPIQIGGETLAARRRAALLGDGWLSAQGSTPREAQTLIQEIQEWREGAGRAGMPFEISMTNTLGENNLDSAKKYEQAGVDRLFLRPEFPRDGRMSVDYVAQWMDRMNETVISRF
jgi:probable F420-dependent oxidoreductase